MADALRVLLATGIPVGSAGDAGFNIWEPLDDWSMYSGRVPPSKIGKYLTELAKRLVALREQKRLTEVALRKESKTATKKLGVPIESNLLARLVTTLVVSQSKFDNELKSTVLELASSDHIDVFARQTSHVILSRMLLYRVAEDKELVERKLSGASLDRYLSQVGAGQLDRYRRAIEFRKVLDDAQELMSEVFYSHLYLHGLFDWWVVPRDVRQKYDESQEATYRRIERAIDIVLEKCIRVLNRFQLDQIERDIWKDVYQEYLPKKERARLGGFYTPDEVVALILDLVGYKPEAPICESKLLDPACGSGAFIVEAAKRLRTHMEKTATCHQDLSEVRDPRERSWLTLRRLIANLYAIDIHPFACFLTEMNFLLATVDLLLKAKQLEPTRKVTELNIGCDDSLRPPEEQIQLKLSKFMQTNERADSLVKDRQKARQIKESKFHFVVGNPPWSGVLRGELSPLFDEGAKKAYKNYDSMSDKIDIYVLFIERGIKWLTDNGRIGFITQNRYLRRDYGSGIRGVIRDTCRVLALIDMWRIGRLVFPGRTTYPCITILERSFHE